MEVKYLGIDIGGTKIKTVVLGVDGSVLEKNEMLTEDSSNAPNIWKEKIFGLVADKTHDLAMGNDTLLRCGISAPGLVDTENRKILYMPERLSGLEHLDWSSELKRNISVINDGHSACLAEYEGFYKNKGIQNMLMLTLGTGVGGGVILNGELFQGNLQRAGHFGHLTVDYNGSPTMTNMVGSLEHAIGNFSVSDRTHGRFENTKDLVTAHVHGDSLATHWWLSSVQKLAAALASLTNAFSPELIVLGGGIAAGAGDALFNPLKEFMSLYEWRPGDHKVQLKKANHGSYAGAIGAAYFAKKITNNIQ
ncbi:MAG: ROK family protein [Maribacter sp.]|nr:ROK family protein [Maribacter sp.]